MCFTSVAICQANKRRNNAYFIIPFFLSQKVKDHEAALERQAAAVDDDGFTLVVGKGKRSRAETNGNVTVVKGSSRGVGKKRKEKVLVDFYRFQEVSLITAHAWDLFVSPSLVETPRFSNLRRPLAERTETRTARQDPCAIREGQAADRQDERKQEVQTVLNSICVASVVRL